jgi:hypothetical protein
MEIRALLYLSEKGFLSLSILVALASVVTLVGGIMAHEHKSIEIVPLGLFMAVVFYGISFVLSKLRAGLPKRRS